MRLFTKPMEVVSRLIMFPRNITKSTEQNLQTAQLLGQESVAAGIGIIDLLQG